MIFCGIPNHVSQAGTSRVTYFSLVVIPGASVVEYVRWASNQASQAAMETATNFHKPQIFP